MAEVFPSKRVQVTYAVRPLRSLGSAPTHSLSLNMVAPSAAEVCTTKCVDQVLPPSTVRLTATELAASERLKARLAYQNVFGCVPGATAGSPADSYGPGAAVLARTSPGRKPTDQALPPSVDR